MTVNKKPAVIGDGRLVFGCNRLSRRYYATRCHRIL